MILKTKLSNGLTVILKEMHHAPVATLWVWYRVASRNEAPGVTGISHWVEHMMFKGTPTFPKGEIDRLVARDGGRFNAFTWLDFTAYFHTFPAAKFDLALRIEADRMQNSLFEPEEAAAERTVVISERQGAENDPTFELNEEVQAAAFRVHPYHHEVIGDLCDLQTMTRDQLYQHYRTYYTPSNAIVVAAGDFDHERLLDRIGELFGAIPAGPEVPPVTRVEPPQKGERRLTVAGEGQTNYVQIAYRAPAARDADFFPMAVLDTILGGPSAFSLGGGGGSNRSSRLYRALVSTGIAAAVDASLLPTIDPFLYTIIAVATSGRTPAEVEAAVDAEIRRVVEQRVTTRELKKAIKQTKAQFAYSSESVTDQGLWCGFSEIVATYEWFDRYIERLEAVTLADVQRVARKVLAPANRVVGWYLGREAQPPAARRKRRKTPAKPAPARKAKAGAKAKTARRTRRQTSRKTN